MTTGVREAEYGLPVPPAALRKAVGEACRELTAAASGRVFEVPEAGVESALESEWESGARYDTILSFLCTPGVVDIQGFVAALERILAEEGWIFMVEPVATRSGALLSRSAARPGSGSRRRRAGTDVVAALRSGGLVVTDLYRREAQSAPAAWRRYVMLKARRESPWTADP